MTKDGNKLKENYTLSRHWFQSAGPKSDKSVWITMVCHYESVWRSATHRKQVAHWVRSGVRCAGWGVRQKNGWFYDGRGRCAYRILPGSLPSRKKAVFLEGRALLRSESKKRAVFLEGKVVDKKETPSKGCLCSYLVMKSPIRSGITSWPAGHYRHGRLDRPSIICWAQ